MKINKIIIVCALTQSLLYFSLISKTSNTPIESKKRINTTYYYAQPASYGPSISLDVDTYPYWNESDYPCYYWYSPYSCNGNPSTYPYEGGCDFLNGCNLDFSY